MALVEERKKLGMFNFTWTIRNFSRCMSYYTLSFKSPSFYASGCEMHFTFYSGSSDSEFVTFDLRPNDYSSLRYSEYICVVFLRKCNGIFEDLIEKRLDDANCTCSTSIRFRDLKEPGVYLDHDNLTVCCRIWKENASAEESPVNCFAISKFEIKTLNYLWVLKDLVNSDGTPKYRFKQTTNSKWFGTAFQDIKFCFRTGETFDDDAIYFEFGRDPKHSRDFASYQIHLIDCNERIVHSIRGEVLLQNSQKCYFMSLKKFISNIEVYLSDGKLTLQCELSLNVGLKDKSVEYRKTDELNDKTLIPKKDSVLDGHDLWRENMRRFYSDGAFSDLIVRTPNQELAVHRAILLGHSEVFRKMLTHDMKEKNSGILEINDFEDGTVSSMLMYLYTNNLGDDADYALVKDLYFAADKYQIKPLQRLCSGRLKDAMDESNVCDILQLADQLRDEELKSSAMDLIASSPRQIMNSEHWKNLRETNPDLTFEIMQEMLFNNIP